MRAGAIVACGMHVLGVLCLLALAASEVKQIAFVVSLSLIYSFLLTGLLSTVTMLVFTFRSDDKLVDAHWLYHTAVFLQTLGLGMLTAMSLNMAAAGDVAFDKPAAPDGEVAPA